MPVYCNINNAVQLARHTKVNSIIDGMCVEYTSLKQYEQRHDLEPLFF